MERKPLLLSKHWLQVQTAPSPRFVPLSREEKLVDAIGNLLGVLHDGVRIDADQLPFTFEDTTVDKHPLDILCLCVENNLWDCFKLRGKVHRARINDNQVGFLARS